MSWICLPSFSPSINLSLWLWLKSYLWTPCLNDPDIPDLYVKKKYLHKNLFTGQVLQRYKWGKRWFNELTSEKAKRFHLFWVVRGFFPTNLNVFVQHENENKTFSTLSHGYWLKAWFRGMDLIFFSSSSKKYFSSSPTPDIWKQRGLNFTLSATKPQTSLTW